MLFFSLHFAKYTMDMQCQGYDSYPRKGDKRGPVLGTPLGGGIWKAFEFAREIEKSLEG